MNVTSIIGMCALLFSGRVAAQAPTQADFNSGLPEPMRRLIEPLADPAGLGGQIAAAIRNDPSGALNMLRDKLGAGSVTGPMIQMQVSDNEWHSLAIFQTDNLENIDGGEMDQAKKVISDSTWQKDRRTLVLDLGAKVTLTQIRVGAMHKRQRSAHNWSSWGKWGEGIDWSSPVIGPDGKVAAYVVFSTYKSNYKDPGAEQRSAVTKWKQFAEQRARR